MGQWIGWRQGVLLAVLALAFLCGAGGGAEAKPRRPTLPEGFTAAGSAKVVEVVDGDTVRLDDGRQVRLVGIQAPKLPLGRPRFRAWPLSKDSKQALEELVEDQSVTLYHGGRPIDRHGRTLAQLVREDGLWVQGEMLNLGMARVYSFSDNRTGIAEMLVLERRARKAGRGIWDEDFYAIRTPDDAAHHLDTFQIVEGEVLTATRSAGSVYLNFGPDWHTDFTIAIVREAMSLFREAELDPLTWKGRRVRVRGWLQYHNGPEIRATHPEQIELLE